MTSDSIPFRRSYAPVWVWGLFLFLSSLGSLTDPSILCSAGSWLDPVPSVHILLNLSPYVDLDWQNNAVIFFLEFPNYALVWYVF